MAETICGIALQTIKYGDKSLILRCLTENGIQVFFIKSMLKGNKNRFPFLSYPLSLIECNFLPARSQGLPVALNVQLRETLSNTGYDFRREAIKSFMAEMLIRFVREESCTPELYAFAEEAVHSINQSSSISSAFPVHFGFQLAKHLGFGIGGEDVSKPACSFTPAAGLINGHHAAGWLDEHESQWLQQLMLLSIQDVLLLKNPKSMSQKTLQVMLRYFKFHFPESNELHSPEILHIIGEDMQSSTSGS